MVAPDERYDVILADPPWRYSSYSRDMGSRTSTSHYASMSPREIAVEHGPIVDRFAADNCALFLWIPFVFTPEIGRLLWAWRFRVVTVAFVWVKLTKRGRLHFGMGRYTRANAEPCWLCVRGRMPVADHGVPQVMLEPMPLGADGRALHSAKPRAVHGRIERLYPNARRIELYARPPVPSGWDSWGHEAPGSYALDAAPWITPPPIGGNLDVEV